MSIEKILEVQDLELRFQTKHLLSDFSFSLSTGQKIGFTGKSGTGKTTFLKCLMGFVQPDSGRIYINEQELTAKNVWNLRSQIGFVPQEPDLGQQNIWSFLSVPFRFKANRHLHLDKKSVVEFFHTFHLEAELLEKESRLLSGGEKQRVALISALLLERKIYFFDEVTSALDAETKRAVVDYFRSQTGLSALFVTHDQNILAMCDSVYALGNASNLKGDVQ